MNPTHTVFFQILSFVIVTIMVYVFLFTHNITQLNYKKYVCGHTKFERVKVRMGEVEGVLRAPFKAIISK